MFPISSNILFGVNRHRGYICAPITLIHKAQAYNNPFPYREEQFHRCVIIFRKLR